MDSNENNKTKQKNENNNIVIWSTIILVLDILSNFSIIDPMKRQQKTIFTYLDENNILVKVYAFKKARKDEITFPANRYSIFNIGAQACKLGSKRVRATI